jgi:hypothetical protein
MPENMTLMRQLVEKYGRKRGEDMYWGMVGKAEGPFAPGRKYHYEHVAWAKRSGVAPLEGTKKPAASGRGRRAR